MSSKALHYHINPSSNYFPHLYSILYQLIILKHAKANCFMSISTKATTNEEKFKYTFMRLRC